MRIALTSNGPGEFSGWVRPLVTALLCLEPHTDVTLFFVPDDYATGQEAGVARRQFPSARVFEARDYVRFALRRPVANVPAQVDVVQYLGGDLSHAARVRARLGGRARTYKFARKRDAAKLDLAYAVDEKNVAQLTRAGVSIERVVLVGNLAIDGALAEAAGKFPATPGDGAFAPGGVLVMPGSRRLEILHAFPFFVQMAVRLRAARPDLPLAFAISPFTSQDELARSLAAGGHRNAWGARGRVVPLETGFGVQAEGGGEPFPILRNAMRHAQHARLAVTLPGTKCIELAALGVPAIVCAPLNAPEIVVINGPLQYLDRIGFAGVALKRAIVQRVDARFEFTAQPNIDLGEAVMPELRGTLMPGEVARRVAAYADDADARAAASARLRALYAAHAGAADRMARSLLEFA